MGFVLLCAMGSAVPPKVALLFGRLIALGVATPVGGHSAVRSAKRKQSAAREHLIPMPHTIRLLHACGTPRSDTPQTLFLAHVSCPGHQGARGPFLPPRGQYCGQRECTRTAPLHPGIDESGRGCTTPAAACWCASGGLSI